MGIGLKFCAALAVTATSLTAAWAYSVQPMIYTLTPAGSGSSARLTIANSKEGQLNVEIEPYSVVADDVGKRTFTSAPDDFLIFPPQASIAPDKTQLFQVRYIGAPSMQKGRVFVLRVRQTNTTDAIKMDAESKVQARLLLSVNFNTTAIVQPKELQPDLAVERDLTPDASGVLHARLVNRGTGVADLTRVNWTLDRGGKSEDVTADQVRYGEAVFLEPGRSRDIALSDKIKGTARLLITIPGQKGGPRRP